MEKLKNKKIEGIISELIDQYDYADTTDRPWIIGFSGAKDSTALLTLVWLALQRIKKNSPYPFQLKRPIYVVCNDTMVENPIISSYVEDVLLKISETARNEGLPIIVKKLLLNWTSLFGLTFWAKDIPCQIILLGGVLTD